MERTKVDDTFAILYIFNLKSSETTGTRLHVADLYRLCTTTRWHSITESIYRMVARFSGVQKLIGESRKENKGLYIIYLWHLSWEAKLNNELIFEGSISVSREYRQYHIYCAFDQLSYCSSNRHGIAFDVIIGFHHANRFLLESKRKLIRLPPSNMHNPNA